MAARHWFFASNPSTYHWDTLFVKGKELWRGARSVAAQRYLKQVQKGDHIVCFHGAPERRVYALATVASNPYLDPHDENGRLYAVDLKAFQRIQRAITFKDLKTARLLRKMRFLARPRLAVSPLSEIEYNDILRMAGMVVSAHR